MKRKGLVELDPIKRNTFDFEMLYLQQTEMQRLSKQADICILQMQTSYKEKPYSNSSYLCLSVSNPFRNACIRLALNQYFDYFILTVIIANCVTLVLGEIIPQTSWSVITDMCFLVIFTAEALIKTVAIGFILGPNSYLRDPWNILDFTVVIVGWVGYILGGQNITVIRTIRILRPLRTINTIPEMKILTISILKSLPMLCDIFVLLFLFLLIFALVGIQLYGGLFSQQCINIDGSISGNLCFLDPNCKEFELNCGNSGCDANQYCWDTHINPGQGVISFDSIPSALLTVFMGITLSGWSDTMRYGRAVTGQKFLNDIYFFFLIVVGAFFLIKLTVAAVFVNFDKSTRDHRSQMALIFMKKQKIGWSPTEPEPAKGRIQYWWYRLRLFSYKIIVTDSFMKFTMTIIIINTAVMASQYYGMSSIHQTINEKINIALNACFLAEMIMKLLGLGLRGYVDDSFNIFDGILVLLGMIEIIFLSGTNNLQALLVFRAFRILRIFKLARRWKKLRFLLGKLIASIKSISYLGLLTLIVVFIFTLLGKALFQGKLQCPQGNTPRMNFDTLFWSFVNVFDLLTTTNWDSGMETAAGPLGIGYSLYYLAIIIIANYIVLNLFLAILIAQFDSKDDEDSEAEGLDMNNLESQDPLNTDTNLMVTGSSRRKDKMRDRLERQATSASGLSGDSYYIFGPENCIRNRLKFLMMHPYFDSGVYCLISISCVILALDEPNKTDVTANFLDIISNVVLACFSLEFIIKSIVLGFSQGKNAYLRNSWNRLDFFIILVSYIEILLAIFGGTAVNISFLRAFRALRALRPLRMVSHNERMKKVVTSVIEAMPAIINVMLITVLFYIIFGILGIIFFNGIMFYCTDPNISLESECIGNFVDSSGNFTQREWRELSYNFDNIFSAVLTLFDLSTLEAWPTYLVAAVDGVGAHRAMIRNYNPTAALFYIAYIFIMNFFIMNLYLGTIISKFNEVQQELDGSEFLSNEQKEWIRTQKLLFLVKPITRFLEPDSRIRKWFYRMVMDYKFDYFIQTVIVINVIFMSLYSYPSDPGLDDFLNIANYVFVAIFIMEMLMKMIGLGLKSYFSTSWNRFDCVVTLVSVFTLFGNIGISNATVLRAFRIVRLFRLIKVLKGFQFVFNTLILSAPALINVGALLVLLFFVYGIAGMYLFGNLDLTVTQIMDSKQNFNTFYNSFCLLFQCITGENWDLIMRDCMGNYGCTGGFETCGNPYIAAIFWVTYTIFGQYFLLNMFIAVIIDNFNEEEDDLSSSGITEKDLKRYQKVWSKFAPLAEDSISTKHLPDFLQKLESPLGFKGQNLSSAQILVIIDALRIQEFNGFLQFADLLWTLASAISGADLSKAPKCEAVQNIVKALPKTLPLYQKGDSDLNQKHQYASRFLAGLIILRAWKEYKEYSRESQKEGFKRRRKQRILNLV